MRRTAVIAVVATALVACSENGPATIGRDGSTVVEDADDVVIGEPPESYRVEYRVEQVDGDDVRTTTAVLTVDRPYRSRFDVDELVRVADFGYFGEEEPGDETEVTNPVPSAAPGDVRADVLPLPPGREVRVVLGRRCQVFRLGASLLDGEYLPGDLVDACIDADGLVLEEITTVDDEVIVRRVATDVDLDPDLDGVSFELDLPSRPADEGGGSVQRVTPTSSTPGTFWVLDAPPTGFSHRGRYATIPPQRARLDDEHTRAQFVAGVTDVYERGIDVLIVEQGGTLGQVPPFGDHPHGELLDDMGALGPRGELVQHPNGAELRILLLPGRFVKVSGTVPGDELVAVARALRPIDGTGLTYIDPETDDAG